MLTPALALAAGVGTSWAAGPANDTFDRATPITLPYTSPPVETTTATVGPDDSAVGIACGVGPANPNVSNSVWYTFTATTDGVAHVVASRSDYYLLDPVVTGSPSAGFTAVSCATGPGAEFPVHAGTTYHVDFIAFGSAGGGHLRFSIIVSPPGADTDGDGAPDSSDGCPTVAASTLFGCPPEPQRLDCAERNVHLVAVRATGNKVRLSGVADIRYAHHTVLILRNGTAVDTTAVREDGSFTAAVDAPTPSLRTKSRYQARIGAAHSENLKLQRRMVGAHLTRTGNRLTFTGRITPPFAGRPARIFLQQYLSCGRKRNVNIKGVRPQPSGHFAISFPVPLRSVGVLMYRATTRVAVHAGGPTHQLSFTLPRPIDPLNAPVLQDSVSRSGESAIFPPFS